MSFDALAPHYHWMEFLCAGKKLQRCRTRFVFEISAVEHALILGEGDGRFLSCLRRKAPQAQITCVDASACMLDLARGRLEGAGLGTGNIHFVHADALEWNPPSSAFDLVVTHFFLDCFTSAQVEALIARLADAAVPRCAWLLADFRIPSRGVARFRAWLMHRAMYAFFRRVTHLSANEVTPPDPFLRAQGFALRERQISEWGLLHSDLWVRKQTAAQP